MKEAYLTSVQTNIDLFEDESIEYLIAVCGDTLMNDYDVSEEDTTEIVINCMVELGYLTPTS